MAWGKKKLTAEQVAQLQLLSEDQKIGDIENWMIDRLDGKKTCRFCRQPANEPASCIRCRYLKGAR
jgi:hypothetical protein